MNYSIKQLEISKNSFRKNRGNDWGGGGVNHQIYGNHWVTQKIYTLYFLFFSIKGIQQDMN